ncbi:42362_t:CDS:1, partial [Gigaspora margarita]
ESSFESDEKYSVNGQFFSSENDENDVDLEILQEHFEIKLKKHTDQNEILFKQIDVLEDQLRLFYKENCILKQKHKKKFIKRIIITSISYFLGVIGFILFIKLNSVRIQCIII